MPIEVQGRRADVDRVEWDRGFRVEVHWKAKDDEGELASYRIRSWVIPYLDDDEYVRSRRDLTNDVCERVVEGVLAEKAQDDAEFESAEFFETTAVRRIRLVPEDEG